MTFSTDVEKFKQMLHRLQPQFSDETIFNIVHETLRGSVQHHVESLLLPNTTRFVPRKVADILQKHERSAVVTSVKLPQTPRQFPGAKIIVRNEDAMVIKQILDFRPGIIVLNNCFYCQSDPLLSIVLEMAKSHGISLLILMQIGSVNQSLLHCSKRVWVPNKQQLPRSIKEVTEWKVSEYGDV